MYYRNNMNLTYPERSDQHMIKVKRKRSCIFDENYPYYDRRPRALIKRFLMYTGLNAIVFLLATIVHGLRIHNRKVLRKNKKLLKDGAITICNHVFLWDYICILKALRRPQYHAAWKNNFEGPNGPFIRNVGGLPIPNDNIKAMVKWQKAVDQVLIDKRWLHFFPEGSMWYYYPDIRPLKPAVFKFSVKHNKPVVPMAFSFRKRRGPLRLFFKSPCADLWIGEPILPDSTINRNEAIEKMHKEAYHVMQGLAGIHPGDPTYNKDQNINNYQKTM